MSRYLLRRRPGGDTPDLPDAPDVPTEESPAKHRRFRKHVAPARKSFGAPGPPFDRRSPFLIGFQATLGVALGYAVVKTIASIEATLILVGLSAFIAVGLDPLVTFQTRHRVPRGLALVVVVLAVALVAAGIVAPAINPVSHEVRQLTVNIPIWRKEIRNGHGQIGRLAKQFHLNNYFTASSENKLTSSLASGALGAGKEVVSALTSTIIVIVLTLYMLASLPSIKHFGVRLVPSSRRSRAQLLVDEILSRVGGFVLGNIFTSLVAGVGTLIWLEVFGLPYAFLLSLLVAVFDLIPVVGSTVAGAAITGIAFEHSLTLAIATAAFYLAYRFFEDYLLVPRVMRHTVKVSPIVTVLSTLLGAAVLGIIGALVAIPIAAALQLLLEEIAIPKLDRS